MQDKPIREDAISNITEFSKLNTNLIALSKVSP